MPEQAICPECTAGKCGNCDGTALNPTTDLIVDCECASSAHIKASA